MGFFRMHLFHGFHRQHHEGHPHGHAFGRTFSDHPRHGAAFAERLVAKISHRLDLDSAQRARLTELLSQLQRQRTALRALAAGPEIDSLLVSANFDRAGATRLADERLTALREATPPLVEALAEFFDGLDFEQQQALRFLLRRRRARSV